MTDTHRPIHRALVSVFHKEGIEDLAAAFVRMGVEVVSTGSTAHALERMGVEVTSVEQVTGFPESFDGRVKTLDPHIHAGILADMTNDSHVRQLEELSIQPFDLVVVDFYPFTQTVRSCADEAAAIEKIDIGGPSMVRGAAKNHASVAVVTDPSDYAYAARAIESGLGFDLDERRELACKAFAKTAAYDASVAQWMAQRWGASLDEPDLTRTWTRSHELRYGENPHQKAALYVDPLDYGGFAQAEQLGGKPMSYNNYVDADAAWRAVWDFAPQKAVAVVKHNNPCGLAVARSVAEAHLKAHACDPVSAYGGVIAANAEVTLEMANNVRPIFTEVIVAPSYEPAALELLKTKKKNLRILKVPRPPQARSQIRGIDGGLLVQGMDMIDAPGDDPSSWKLVSGADADEDMMRDLQFAWRAVRCVKSNAILLAHGQASVGIGMGQVNRVDSCHLAVERANTLADGERRSDGSVAASDAFFPFADGVRTLMDAGVRAIVQPGGSIRDEEVITAANRAGVTMYLTGTRHFFH